jgi:hypothetical protein
LRVLESFEFEHFFAFPLVCRFSFLSISLDFGLLVVLHVVYDSKFKLCSFVLSMYSSRGKWRNQVVLGLICDE